MCGIIGYTGYRSTSRLLLNSLQRLEYRGYDSCGVAILGQDMNVYKTLGRVENLRKLTPSNKASMGIGHTRWATHGAVTTVNAHPHLDCGNTIAVAHNGVIDNFQLVREQLSNEGHTFKSETDTEVIAHLIEKLYQGDLEDAVVKSLNELTGSYAIVVLSYHCRKLVAALRESPLVIGVGDREGFVASDVAAFLDYTDRAIYLEDGDVCTISDSEISIKNEGRKVIREIHVIPWNTDQVQKSGYEHFMLKEIHEQPSVIEHTLSDRISVAEPEIKLDIAKSSETRRIVLTACGSSYHAALVGEYLFNRICNISTRAITASEFDQMEPVLDQDWIIGITQSGETADTIRALKKAKNAGCSTLAIVNVLGNTASRICDQTIFIRAGPEISVAATKTFIAQLTTLYLMALSWGPTDPRTRMSLIEELKLLPAKVSQVLNQESRIAQSGEYLAKYRDAFFIARSFNYPIAMEGALKLKEISYIHAEAYPAGELKHGPFALLGPKMPVIALMPMDDTYGMMQTSVKEIKARGAPVIALTDERDRDAEKFADSVIRLPTVNPLFSPILNTIALQFLAYYAAKRRGCPIDLPANLAKSVTVL